MPFPICHFSGQAISPFRSAAKTTSASASSLVATLPSGHAAGDLLFAAVRVNASVTISMPAGWTEIATDAGSVTRVFWKIDSGSESNPTVSLSGSAGINVLIAAFQGVNTSSPINASGITVGTSSSTITCPALTSTGHAFLVVIAISGNNATFTPTTGWSTDATAVSSSSVGSIFVEWSVSGTANPPSVTVSASVSSGVAGRQFAINAA